MYFNQYSWLAMNKSHYPFRMFGRHGDSDLQNNKINYRYGCTVLGEVLNEHVICP